MEVDNLHIHVHVYPDPAVTQALHRIEERLQEVFEEVDDLEEMGAIQLADISNITRVVEENSDVQASAIVLLGQLSQLIRDNATDQAALNSLADQLDAQQDELAAAVVANTPQAPEPPA